jgi:hypothetical protein
MCTLTSRLAALLVVEVESSSAGLATKRVPPSRTSSCDSGGRLRVARSRQFADAC